MEDQHGDECTGMFAWQVRCGACTHLEGELRRGTTAQHFGKVIVVGESHVASDSVPSLSAAADEGRLECAWGHLPRLRALCADDHPEWLLATSVLRHLRI